MASRVLIIGNDGRTDVIAEACARSDAKPALYAFSEMPIPGLREKCREVFTGSLTDVDRLAEIVASVNPDLAIVGPEAPLKAGFVDALARLGVLAFGPSQRSAAIETSKSWARDLLDRNGIPGNPEHRLFHDEADLHGYIKGLESFVVKPDGLTGGKGVRVLGDHFATLDEGHAYAVSVLRESGAVQIEQKLEGQEFSLQTITDGEAVVHCPLVQDHKRAFEGDRGPNTGGMGSYSSADFGLPFLDGTDIAGAKAVNEAVIDALARETGERYKGVLYGGFIATGDGVSLIEYNARFGDPEVMNVLPLLEADFVELCSAVAAGRLADVECRFASKATVCKYVVPAGYPTDTTDDQEILVPADLDRSERARWYWAASKERDGRTFMSTSRAGAVVGIGDTLADAESVAEEAARAIGGPVRHRADIGRSEAIEARCQHMRRLRAGTTSAV
jgi:phosphoribosylamine---glycine ligase